MLKEYILQNWALILIMMAFSILLKTTVFLDRKIKGRMYALIGVVFVLSIIVFLEFNLAGRGESVQLRTVLTAIRYSATPFIIAMIIYTLAMEMRWFVFLPAIALAVINMVSIFNGMVFCIRDDCSLARGPLGYLPYVVVGLYSAALVYILFKQSNKQSTEIIPIFFLCFAFATGLILPFFLGKDYSQVFCVTIIIALFVYYVFSILQLTKKDSLTSLLNRQAYYADVGDNSKDIDAVISIDMNGLKEINDTGGHAAGDEALKALALCFLHATTSKQSVYRVGGDEFVIVCRKTSETEIHHLVERIQSNVSEAHLSCAIGYCFCPNNTKTTREMLKESDEMMYSDKEKYYSNPDINKYRD